MADPYVVLEKLRLRRDLNAVASAKMDSRFPFHFIRSYLFMNHAEKEINEAINELFRLDIQYPFLYKIMIHSPGITLEELGAKVIEVYKWCFNTLDYDVDICTPATKSFNDEFVIFKDTLKDVEEVFPTTIKFANNEDLTAFLLRFGLR